MNLHNQMSEITAFENLSKLIVNYLPKTFSEQDVLNLFSVFGHVHSCKLMVDLKTGVSKGWAFVNFFNHEDAERAISSYNGLKMQNKIIRVAFADGDPDSKAQLFVAGLKKNMSQSELEEIFQPYGKVTWSYIMPKGAGLIRFEKKEEAMTALKELNGKLVKNNPFPLNISLHQNSGGKAKTQTDDFSGPQYYTPKAPSSLKTKLLINSRFSPSHVIPKPEDEILSTLYVSGLPKNFDEARLYKMFSPYGGISSAALMTEPNTKLCKGVAFVTMMKHEEAINAIQSVHGIVIDDREIRVSFKLRK